MVRNLKPHRLPPGLGLGLGLLFGAIFWWGTYKLLERFAGWLTF